VRDTVGRRVHVGSNLEFLKVGRSIEVEDVDQGERRDAKIDSVTVAIDPQTQVPQLVVALRYAGEITPQPSVVDTAQEDEQAGVDRVEDARVRRAGRSVGVVDVDVYAADRALAQQIAEQIRHAFRWELPGQRVAGNVFTRTRTIVAPRLLPHANRRIRRYSGNYEFLLHPQP